VEALRDVVRLGLIQTTLDNEAAWTDSPVMSRYEAERAWAEIVKGFRALGDSEFRPHIVLIPELAVPQGRIKDLKGLARITGSMVIGGIDYQIRG